MKVLFTVSTYYPLEDGVSRVTQYMAEGLARNGHNVVVITSSCSTETKKEIHNGVVIRRVDLHTKCGLYFGNKKEYRRLLDKEANNADIMINVCTQNAFTDVILNRIDKYKCKKILYMHGMFDFRLHKVDFSGIRSIANKAWKEIRWFFYYRFNSNNFKKYDRIIQLHEMDYANIFFRKHYGIESYIINNAADDIFFNDMDSTIFQKPYDDYIIYVANYGDGKNQKLAISKFLRSNINPRIGLVLIGCDENKYSSNLVEYIKREKRKLSFSDEDKPIVLLYDVDRKEIPFYISNARLFLMTSKREVFPVSLVESIACGTPFVSTDVGVAKYIFGGVVADKKDISTWINKFLYDYDLYESMSSLCKKYARKCFRVNDKVTLLENEIERIIGGNNV